MNFRSILSKSSLKSSSSGKLSTHSDEISKLQSEIESLKQTIDSLKVSVESRDAAIGTLAREKEKIYVELKCAQRTNRNLHQQLIDERDIHSKEKEFLIDEIKRLSKRNENEMNALQNENGNEDQSNNLFQELKSKDEVIYNIGAKYMKIKSSKEILQKKLEKMQDQNKKTCENIIFQLQDNRKALDNILDNLLQSSTVSPNSKKYLNLLQMNADLHYENIQLKIYLSAKDSADIIQRESNDVQELSDKVCVVEKNSNSGVKPDVKIKSTNEKTLKDSRRTIHSKLKSLTTHDWPDCRGIYRSASDSCIIRRNLSKCLNIKT